MANTNNLGSGDGTRPTTDGGVDNVGAAGSFTPGKGKRNEPVPPEKMSEVRKDRESARRDDSAPMGLTQSPDSTPNVEPRPAPQVDE
jgi:hypothetical protein